MSETTTTTPETPPAELQNVPVLPLRDVVVYPHMVIPLFVGREKSIQALDVAMRTDKRIMLVAQKQADVDDPKADDLYRIATVATILQLLKLPDGTVKVLVEGVDRARIELGVAPRTRPSLPTTRCAGTKRSIGVDRIAAATPRCASGRPTPRATSA